ncbi:hypothetical protein NDU88_004231, partial [Pleurodeles waltl]
MYREALPPDYHFHTVDCGIPQPPPTTPFKDAELGTMHVYHTRFSNVSSGEVSVGLQTPGAMSAPAAIPTRGQSHRLTRAWITGQRSLKARSAKLPSTGPAFQCIT